MIAVARPPIRRTALLAALAAAALVSTAACSSSTGTATSTSAAPASTSASSSAPDLAALVIEPSDIPIPGFTKQGTQPIQQGPATGVAVTFAHADRSRQIADVLIVLPDAASARLALQGALSAAKTQFPGATAAPAPVGESGMIYTLTNAGKAVTVVVFQQGRALVTMEFDSAVNDPVPADVVVAVVKKQDEKIKAGLK